MLDTQKATIYLVVPCYNEQAVIETTAARLKEILYGLITRDKITRDSKVLFVNDGSKDRTWDLIKGLCNTDKLFCAISLARNAGHQKALLAGLMTVKEKADAVISLDADLQDDVGTIEAFIDRFYEGNDIVYGVRSSRKTDSLFKKNTAVAFYRLLSFFGAEVIFNHADYRLMSRRALEELAQFKEVNLFLRGLVPMIGYRTATVEYVRAKRFAGQTKYPFGKMISFAIDGITSLSVKPIRLITTLGVLIFGISILMLLYFLIVHFLGKTVAGWTSIAVSVWAIGGLQLLSIGIIGEYIGKIYLETKQRPRYTISESIGIEKLG